MASAQTIEQRTGRALGAAARRRTPRSPAAPNTSTICACPACCTARSSAARSRTAASAASTSSAARARRGRAPRGDHRRHPHRRSAIPIYGPAFHDQPILAVDKVHYVGEPVAVVLAADPHVAEAAAQLIVAEYEELPAVFDEVEAMTSAGDRARRAQAGRHLPRSQASAGQAEHQCRARFPSAARRRGGGFAAGRSRVRAHLPHPAGAAPAARAVRLGRRGHAPMRPDHPHRLAVAVVRAHRDRAPARLAGKPRAGEGAAISAAASAPSSTSSSKRWWRRSRSWCGGR